MRRARQLSLLLLMLTTALLAGTPGSFRGTLVDNPHGEKAQGHWIYVKGRNGMLRRVEISKAKVSYGASVPKAKREGLPELALKPGTEVRVTAEQDRSGEWRASTVELLGVDNDDLDFPPDHPEVDPVRMNSQT